MNLDSFTGPGSTPSRRRFWDKVTQAILASRKVEGKNVSVDEKQGYGSLISIPSSSPGRSGTPHSPPFGACCNEDSTCNIRTELECIDLGGTYLGNGTSCDPNPCGGGACCCHGVCVNQPSEAACLECQGAYYYGDGTSCSDPDVDCGDVGCCTHVDTTCHTTVFGEECTTFFAGGFCVEGDTLCCDALTQQACPFSSDLGSTYCCDLDHTCCGGFDPSTCCNTLTEQCVHPVDPDTEYVGSFCCPIDWTPCGFEPCCDPETQVCCDIGGGFLACYPSEDGCPP